MRTTGTFDKLVKAIAEGPRYLDNRGGARSSKTFSELQIMSLLADNDGSPTLTSIVGDTLPHLKRGAIRDFQNVMREAGWWDENRWSRSECIYTFPSGSQIEFFGVDAPGKVQGPARDRLVINEANFIDWEIVRQLLARTSGLVVYDYNPSAPFWGTEELPKRGRYKLVHSTYKDNQYLSPEIVRELEANKGAGNWWRVYGLGLIGVVEGQVFDFKIVDKMPEPEGYKESWGMDFGFTHDPTTLVRCLIHTGKREIYVDEMLYQVGMTNPEIAAALKTFGIKRRGAGPTVRADAAEPKSISEVAAYGLDVVACDKRVAVREQLQLLRGWTIYVTRRSVNAINEGRKYLFKQRPDGTWTNEPIEFFNHVIDAIRYACGPFVLNPNAGRYSTA